MPSKSESTKAAKAATTKKAPARAKTAKATTPTHEAIQLRAYELSQSNGGDPVDNWLEAERQLVETAAPKPRRRKAAAAAK